MLLIVRHELAPEHLLDGAHLLQEEVVRALGRMHPLETRVVGLGELLAKGGWKGLAAARTVYCAADPFAHFLFMIRERTGGRFAIVRMVQTGAWAGYLLQELLCRPLERPCDTTIYPSAYCLESHAAWFGRAAAGMHVACRVAPPGFRRGPAGPRKYRAAYVGRLSHDKNLADCLRAFALIAAGDRTARFVVAGAPDPGHFGVGAVAGLVRDLGLQGCCTCLGPLTRRGVESLLHEVETLIFPSTSTVESFGRVVAEALLCGVRCVAADHAAMPELLGPEALVPVERSACQLSCHANSPTGVVSPAALCAAVTARTATDEEEPIGRLTSVDALARGIFAGQSNVASSSSAGPAAARPLGRLLGIVPADARQALDATGFLLERTRCLADPVRRHEVLASLSARTSLPQRTAGFVERGRVRVQLAELGGWALESGHLLGFAPILQVEATGRPPSDRTASP